VSEPKRSVVVPNKPEGTDEIFPKSEAIDGFQSRGSDLQVEMAWPKLLRSAARHTAALRAGSGQVAEEIAMHALSRRGALCLAALIAASSLVAPIPSSASDKLPLAIKGYDPVAYFVLGEATRGLPEIEYEWDEHRYRFSRPEHRELFKADPVRYAPQFINVCAMALALGRIVEADPESWLISDGKLYIFGGPAGRELFQQDLAGNAAKANQNSAQIRRALSE
jgi:hypothetical protein